MFSQLAPYASRVPEPPPAHIRALSDSSRTQQPPAPEIPYKPYSEETALSEAPYKPYDEKPALSEPPYKPYGEKPALDEVPYEPYKGI